MIGGVAKEDTQGRARGEFVRSGGRQVRVAGASKHPKMVVGGMDTIESKVGCGHG